MSNTSEEPSYPKRTSSTRKLRKYESSKDVLKSTKLSAQRVVTHEGTSTTAALTLSSSTPVTIERTKSSTNVIPAFDSKKSKSVSHANLQDSTGSTSKDTASVHSSLKRSSSKHFKETLADSTESTSTTRERAATTVGAVSPEKHHHKHADTEGGKSDHKKKKKHSKESPPPSLTSESMLTDSSTTNTATTETSTSITLEKTHSSKSKKGTLRSSDSSSRLRKASAGSDIPPMSDKSSTGEMDSTIDDGTEHKHKHKRGSTEKETRKSPSMSPLSSEKVERASTTSRKSPKETRASKKDKESSGNSVMRSPRGASSSLHKNSSSDDPDKDGAQVADIPDAYAVDDFSLEREISFEIISTTPSRSKTLRGSSKHSHSKTPEPSNISTSPIPAFTSAASTPSRLRPSNRAARATVHLGKIRDSPRLAELGIEPLEHEIGRPVDRDSYKGGRGFESSDELSPCSDEQPDDAEAPNIKRKTWSKIHRGLDDDRRMGAQSSGSSTDFVAEEAYKANRILPTEGYLIETLRDEPAGTSSTAQNELAYEKWLLETFMVGTENVVHYVPIDNNTVDDILFITIKTEYTTGEHKELNGIKILVTFQDRDQRITISSAQLRQSSTSVLKGSSRKTVSVRKLLAYINPALSKSNMKKIKANQEILDGLLTLARLRLSYCHADKHFKVGVVYWAGEKDDEATLNHMATPAFHHFVSILGETVQLENWEKFAGGLDTTSRSLDGKTSLFTEWKGNDLMYHVAPLMECSAHQRRVHIGNDTLVVVFTDSKKPFNAEYIQSKFNQVFLVVSIESDETVIAKAALASNGGPPQVAQKSTPSSFTSILTPPLSIKRRKNSASTASTGIIRETPPTSSGAMLHERGSGDRRSLGSPLSAGSIGAGSLSPRRESAELARSYHSHERVSASSGSLGSTGASAPNNKPSPLFDDLREEDEDSGAQGDDESPIKLNATHRANSLSNSPEDGPSPVNTSLSLTSIPEHNDDTHHTLPPPSPSSSSHPQPIPTSAASTSSSDAANVASSHSTSLPDVAAPHHVVPQMSSKRGSKKGNSQAGSPYPDSAFNSISSAPDINIPKSTPHIETATRKRKNTHKNEPILPASPAALPTTDTWYRIAVLRRNGIDPFKPKLPWPNVMQHGPEFREWLLTKITSGMVAAFSSRNFQDRVQANRATFLSNLTRSLPTHHVRNDG